MYVVHLQRYDNFAASPTFSSLILDKLLSRSALPHFIPHLRKAPILLRATIILLISPSILLIFPIILLIFQPIDLTFRPQLLSAPRLPAISFLSVRQARKSTSFMTNPVFLFAKMLRESFSKNFSKTKKIIVEKFGKLKSCFPWKYCSKNLFFF